MQDSIVYFLFLVCLVGLGFLYTQITTLATSAGSTAGTIAANNVTTTTIQTTAAQQATLTATTTATSVASTQVATQMNNYVTSSAANNLITSQLANYPTSSAISTLISSAISTYDTNQTSTRSGSSSTGHWILLRGGQYLQYGSVQLQVTTQGNGASAFVTFNFPTALQNAPLYYNSYVGQTLSNGTLSTYISNVTATSMMITASEGNSTTSGTSNVTVYWEVIGS